MKKILFLLLLSAQSHAQIVQSYKTCDSILCRSATTGNYLWSSGQTSRQIVVQRGSGYLELNCSGAIYSATVIFDMPVGTPNIGNVNQLGVTLYDNINLPNPYYQYNYTWQYKTASTAWINVSNQTYYTPSVTGQYRLVTAFQGCKKSSIKLTLK